MKRRFSKADIARIQAGKLPEPSEDDLLRKVLALAKIRGWRTAHFRPAQTKNGWRTAVSGDGKGWPDLILVRNDRIIAAELKAGKNEPTDEQLAWLLALAGAKVDCRVWRDEDWDEIQTVLE